MSRVKAGSKSWKCQGRTRAAQGQAEPEKVRVILGQVCSALEGNDQGTAIRTSTDQSRGRERPHQDSSKQGSGLSLSRSRADQTYGREEAQQSKQGQDMGKGET